VEDYDKDDDNSSSNFSEPNELSSDSEDDESIKDQLKLNSSSDPSSNDSFEENMDISSNPDNSLYIEDQVHVDLLKLCGDMGCPN